MVAAEPRAFVFQYTSDTNTADQLANTKEGDVLEWLWSENFEIGEGDWVFFLRSGDAPKDWRGDWRGFVGMGQVTAPPYETRGRQTPEVVPVVTRYLELQRPLVREMFWHHHLVPRHPYLMTGARGTNFRLSTEVGALLMRELLRRADGDIREEMFLPLLDYQIIDDRIWQGLRNGNLRVSFSTAIVLHSFRALQAFWPVADEGSETLLAGIFIIPEWNKHIPSDDRKIVSWLRTTILESISESKVNELLGQILKHLDTNNPFARFSNLEPTKLNDKITRILELSTSSVRLSTSTQKEPVLEILDLILGTIYSQDRYLYFLRSKGIDVAELLASFSQLLRSNGEVSSADKVDNFVEANARLSGNGNLGASSMASQANNRSPREPGIRSSEKDTDTEQTAPSTSSLPHRIITTAPTRNDDPYSIATDHLNVDAEARAFARLIASSSFKPPLAVGIFGRWGSGKTFFMSRIEKELDALSPLTEPVATEDQPPDAKPENGFCTHVVRIRFNAWHYMETNVWASLVDVIFKQLDAWLRKGDAEKAHESADSLFDSLSTAQEMKLEAIEALADRLRDAEAAREKLASARRDLADKGPDAWDWWQAISENLDEEARSGFEKASKELGLDDIADDATKLQETVRHLHGSIAEGQLIWRSLRNRFTDAGQLWLGCGLLLTVTVIGILIARSNVTDMTGIVAFVGLALSTATGWAANAARIARSVADNLRKFDAAIGKVMDDKIAHERSIVAKAEAAVIEAETQLEVAENAAAEAQRALWEGSAIGRISAFIRKRAEGDDYSRHLGVIATIRRDFEQLTALMTQADDDQSARKAWDEQKRLLQAQAEALEKRYRRNRKPPPADDDPVIRALADMRESLAAEERPHRKIERIVLFIDDLDRCPPSKVYDVLQAVHLFLAFRLFVIVVGVDTRWMEGSLEKMLDKLVTGENGARPRDYLEKIFQIPYWTRPMEEQASQAFVGGLLDDIRTREAEPAEQEEAFRAPEISGTPDEDGKASRDEMDGIPDMPPEAAMRDLPGDAAQAVLYRPEPDAAPGHEPSESGADSDATTEAGDDRSGERPRIFEPVSFTQEEKDFLRRLAPFAGDTPRQALRFVNVYGLVKSVIEESEDEAVQAIDRFALMAQLAIATGSQEAAPLYFSGISAGSTAISEIIEPTMPTPPASGPDRNRIRNILLAYADKNDVPIMDLVSKHADDNAASRNGIVDAYINETGLLEKLRAAAPIARRYTFAA